MNQVTDKPSGKPVSDSFAEVIQAFHMDLPCDSDDCPNPPAWEVDIHRCAVYNVCSPCYEGFLETLTMLVLMTGGVECTICSSPFWGAEMFHRARPL